MFQDWLGKCGCLPCLILINPVNPGAPSKLGKAGQVEVLTLSERGDPQTTD